MAQHFITLNGIGRIHFITAGHGTPLVLLHGLGASTVAWYNNISALSNQYTVYAPDLPGHGKSTTYNTSYDLALGVRFVIAFLDALGLERVVLVGNSLGGLLAMATALHKPTRVRALVLADAAGLGQELAWPIRLASLPGIWNLLDALGPSMFSRFLPRLFHRPERIESSVREELMRLAMLPATRKVIRLALHNSVTILGLRRSLVLFDNLTYSLIPTLVLWGQEDQIIPVKHAYQIAHWIPSVRVITLPNCGHWPQMEQAQTFNLEVLTFLEREAVGEEKPKTK